MTRFSPVFVRQLAPWCVALLLVLTGCSEDGAASVTASGGGFQLPSSKDAVVAANDATSGGGGEEDIAGQSEDVEQPGEDVENPNAEDAATPEDVEQPGDDSEQPGEDAEQPGEDAEQPGEDAEQPGEDAEQPACTDEDGDGYGNGCQLGEDCDDMNPNFSVSCPNCTIPGTPGCACKAGAKPVACYSGDPATMGKGICVKGSHQCSGGYWTECKGDVLPQPEICDNKDNDCDGETDESVKSTCGTCDLTCNQQTIGSGGSVGWNLNSENATGLGLDPQGNVTLDMSQISLNLKFIWIANSPNNTVSKVDCKTVTEVGRYQVCSDPSRTSVDLEGNVWVGCRGDGSVAKIIAEKKNCVDKNGNGIIETSTGPAPIGNDECVKFIVNPGKGSYARGAAVDKENHVWIGYWNQKTMVRLNANTGATMTEIPLGVSPYGLVIDQKGMIWAQGEFNTLVMIDPLTQVVTKNNTLPQLKFPAGAYGLNVDKYGRLWVASGNKASVYDPKTLQWKVVNMNWGGGRGVATANDGYTYVAVDGSGGAVKINGNVDPPQVEGFIKGAGSPVGAAIDYDGFVWVVNQGGSSATKLDPTTMAAVGTVGVGSSPYTYSDMTGYTLNYFTAPKGQYSTVFFGGIAPNPVTTNQPKQVWQSISAEADLPPGTALRFRLRAGNSKAELEAAKWSEPIDFPPEVFPYDLTKANIIGNLLQVEVQLTTKDKKFAPVLKSISAKSKLI
jgi:streptogramin lyase